jgi:phage-related minor tail protein
LPDYCDNFIRFKAEIQRLRQELEATVERGDRQRDNLQQKMANAEKDYQLALQRAKQAHEDDVARLTEIKVAQHLFVLDTFKRM